MYLPILTYHRLLPDSPDAATDPKRIAVSQARFRSHLAWLTRLGYRCVSLAEYPQQVRTDLPPVGRCYAITFDDGYEEVLTLGLPVLREFNCTATVFAVSGELAGHNAWDDGQARLLSADQYKELRRAGITIGAHTAHHAHLTQVPAETAAQEIKNSRVRLEEALGEPVKLFAYPYGEYNPAVELSVREAGFEAAFATDRAPQNHATNLFALRRVVIFPRTSIWQLLWKVQPWYPAYQDYKRRRGDTGTR
jgi:peptidoglycan/xylan/chitin deacetylase (PgdA/CDA1 family)